MTDGVSEDQLTDRPTGGVSESELSDRPADPGVEESELSNTPQEPSLINKGYQALGTGYQPEDPLDRNPMPGAVSNPLDKGFQAGKEAFLGGAKEIGEAVTQPPPKLGDGLSGIASEMGRVPKLIMGALGMLGAPVAALGAGIDEAANTLAPSLNKNIETMNKNRPSWSPETSSIGSAVGEAVAMAPLFRASKAGAAAMGDRLVKVPNLSQTPEIEAAMTAKPPFAGSDVKQGPSEQQGIPANENVTTGEMGRNQPAVQQTGVNRSAGAVEPLGERPTTAEAQVPANENNASALTAGDRVRQEMEARDNPEGLEPYTGPTKRFAPSEPAMTQGERVRQELEQRDNPEGLEAYEPKIQNPEPQSENFPGRGVDGQNENIEKPWRSKAYLEAHPELSEPAEAPTAPQPKMQAMARKTDDRGRSGRPIETQPLNTKSPEEILKSIEEGGKLEELEKRAGVPKKQLTPPNLPNADATWGEVPTKARNAIEKWFNNTAVGKLFVGEGTRPGETASFDIRKNRYYRNHDVIDNMLEGPEKVIGALPDEAQREIRTFIDKTEPGAKINSMPELQKHIDTIREAHDMTDDLIKKYGTFDVGEFDRQRWPQQFKDPEKAREALDAWRDETAGRGNPRKNQTPSLEEMTDAGHELKTNNPITALRMESQAKYEKLAISNIIQAGKDRGMIKSRVPEELVGGQQWVPLKARALNGETLYAPEGYANVFNRNYSPSFSDTLTGRRIMGPINRLGNWSSAFSLGLSPFHGTTMVQERAVNQIARALQLENPATTADSLRKIVAGRGKHLLEEWVDRGTHPELTKFIDKLDDIGAKPLGRNPEMELGQKSSLGATKSAGRIIPDAWSRAVKDFKGAKEELRIATPGQRMLIVPRQTLNGIGEAMHTMSEPLFGVIIPRMKVSSFAENLGAWMEKNPNFTDVQANKAAHEIWKDIESRFGLMNHDNLWIDKRVKEVLTAALTSMSWNYGFLRNASLGLKDAAMHPQRASMKSKDYNPNITSLVGLAAVMAMTGTAISLIKTKHLPGSLMETFLPKSGGKDDKGQPEHILPPGFGKDWLSYTLHPLDELISKQKVVWQALIALGTNKGWNDTPKGPRYGDIADTSKHSLLDYMKEHGQHYLKQQMPFSISSITKHHSEGTNIGALERFFALKEAPKAFTQPANPKTDFYRHNDYLQSHGQRKLSGKVYAEGGEVEGGNDNSLTGINSEVAPQIASRANWNKFEREARPSTNIEDDRNRGWSKYIPSLGQITGLSDANYDDGGLVVTPRRGNPAVATDRPRPMRGERISEPPQLNYPALPKHPAGPALVGDQVADQPTFRGRGSWYGNYQGTHNWNDPDDNNNPALAGASNDEPGVALGNQTDTLGQRFKLVGPNGQSATVQHSDKGPSAQGRTVDVNSAAADALDYSPASFPTNSEFSAYPIGEKMQPTTEAPNNFDAALAKADMDPAPTQNSNVQGYKRGGAIKPIINTFKRINRNAVPVQGTKRLGSHGRRG